MRKRKRDWPIMVYKYRAYIDDVPDYVWQHCRQQNDLWNKLVERLNVRLQEWESFKENAEKDERATFWNLFWSDCQAIVENSMLGWEARADIFDRFSISVRSAFKNTDRGMPKFHAGIKQVRLTHRFTGGGLPVDRLFAARSNRFSILQTPPEDVYDDESQYNRRRRIVFARFGLDGKTFDFRLRLHRPLPEGAILKNVAWLGEYQYHLDPAKRWQWYIAMWLEIPPADPLCQRRQVGGLDLGWRKFEDYIRIGFLVDEKGQQFEFRLPLDASNYRSRRDNLPSSWSDKYELDEQIGQLVEEIKTEIKPALAMCDLPEEISRSVGQLSKMRQGGLVRLRQALVELNNEKVVPVVDMLTAWQKQNDRLRHQSVQLARRLSLRREWIYGNIAAWISQEYGAVVWEGDFDIKGMAEDGDKDASLKRADRYRQIAAIGELRQAIKNAAGKSGTEIVAGKTAGTTRRCSLCGKMIEVSPATMLMCEEGHLLDTDENAARNLLSQMGRNFEAESDLRDFALQIPIELKDVVVPVKKGVY